MSRWWPEQIRIFLHPTQVALFRLSRGRTQRTLDKCIIPCNSASNEKPLWRNAIQTLEVVLPEFCTRRGEATVVLSNHFVRYALISNASLVSNAAEEQALINHHYNRIYGAAAAQWSISVSHDADPASPRVTCAVDASLIAALRALFPANKPCLRSVQPHLMAAFNQYRRQFQASTWLALVENGMLCLARLENNQWRSIKCCLIGQNWQHELAIQIEREKLVTGAVENQQRRRIPVLVFSPEYPEPIDVSPEDESDQGVEDTSSNILDPACWPEPVMSDEPAQAMALMG